MLLLVGLGGLIVGCVLGVGGVIGLLVVLVGCVLGVVFGGVGAVGVSGLAGIAGAVMGVPTGSGALLLSGD